MSKRSYKKWDFFSSQKSLTIRDGESTNHCHNCTIRLIMRFTFKFFKHLHFFKWNIGVWIRNPKNQDMYFYH